MSELIYKTFEYLTDVPYNFWGWILLLTAPILVFCIGPDKSQKVRFGRLVLAIGTTYILINLALHTSRQIDWNTYQECQSQFSDGAIQHHKECGEINIADGASAVFYAFFGYIPATGYVGLWELLWRIIHRKKIKQIGKECKGMWFSNTIIIIFIPIGLFVGYIALSLIHFIFFKGQ